MEKVMTKREFYNALINYATNGTFAYDTEDGAVAVNADDIVTFAENEIALLDKKADKAKERAAKKKAEADPIKELALSLLNDTDFKTTAEIMADVDDEDITKSKMSYRLSALVRDGVAESTDVPVTGADGKKSKVKGYKLIAVNA